MKIIIEIRDEELNDFAINKVKEFIDDAKETGQCLTCYKVNGKEVQSFTEKKYYGWKIFVGYDKRAEIKKLYKED